MRRSRPPFVLLLATLVGLAACSSGGGGTAASSTDGGATSTTSASNSTSTTPTTQPPGTDAAAVTPTLQALIRKYDSAVAAILHDPRVASDRESPMVTAYLALFTSGSGFADGALKNWVREGASGRFYRPGPRGQLTESTVTAVTQAEADEVTFTICALNSIEITNAEGAVLESQGGQTAASVVAMRTNGIWLLRDLTQASTKSCPPIDKGA